MTGVEANAIIVDFEDAFAANTTPSNNYDPATFYQATDGVTFSGTYSGVWGGVGNGDPGNWDLEGTNGSAFLGTNQSTSGSPTINFADSVTDLSFDVGVAFGWNIDFLVTGFLNGSTIETQTFSITDDNNGEGTWSTVNLANEVDSVTVQMTGGTASAFGIDNYSGTASASVPFEFSPAMGLLLVGGLFGGKAAYGKYRASKVKLED